MLGILHMVLVFRTRASSPAAVILTVWCFSVDAACLETCFKHPSSENAFPDLAPNHAGASLMVGLVIWRALNSTGVAVLGVARMVVEPTRERLSIAGVIRRARMRSALVAHCNLTERSV